MRYVVVTPARPSVCPKNFLSHELRLHLLKVIAKLHITIFEIFIFAPGSIEGQKLTFFGEVVVSGTLSTFQRVDIWYSKTSLCMSCGCATRFRNFHFTTKGLMRVEKRRFHFPVQFVSWTKSTSNWYSRIWLDMSCRISFVRKSHF